MSLLAFGSGEFDAEGRYVQCDFGDLSIICLLPFWLFIGRKTASQVPLYG